MRNGSRWLASIIPVAAMLLLASCASSGGTSSQAMSAATIATDASPALRPTATDEPTPSPSPIASPTPSPASPSPTTEPPGDALLADTEAPTNPDTPTSEPIVVITKVYNLSKTEHVVIENIGETPADLSSWHLSGSKDRKDRLDDYVFPSGFILQPGSTVTLHCGENGVRNPPSDIHWTTSCVWSNQGELVYLRDRECNLVDSYEYS